MLQATPEDASPNGSSKEMQTLTLFSSCTLISLRTFLVLGLAMVLQRRKTNLRLTNRSLYKTIGGQRKNTTQHSFRGEKFRYAAWHRQGEAAVTAGSAGDR